MSAETTAQLTGGAEAAAPAQQPAGGFAAGLKPSNDNARVVSGKFAPEAILRPSSGSLSSFSDVEFYYMDADGNQIGPAPVSELRLKFKSGNINTECLFWYDGMSGWENIGSNAELMQHINIRPPSRPLPPPPVCACPPPRTHACCPARCVVYHPLDLTHP
jgi:hypothetical protein